MGRSEYKWSNFKRFIFQNHSCWTKYVKTFYMLFQRQDQWRSVSLESECSPSQKREWTHV